MPEILIRNFKQGLDTRREVLSSLPGTLQNLVNAHINQGGEIEKRYAFVRTALPPNTFGLESTSEGLITFGSDPDPGGWPRGAVTGYQRLQHPAVLDGAVYDAQYHAMTDVAWSYSFLGRAWVAATFADGRTFLYYDGVVVDHSRDGIVLPGFTASKNRELIADRIAERAQTALGDSWGTSKWEEHTEFYFWALTSPFVGHDFDGAILLSPTGVTFSPIISYDSSSGYINTFNRGAQPERAGTAATATYTISGTIGSSFTILAPVPYNSTNNYINLVGDSFMIYWNTSNEQTAADLAAAINSKTSVTGYSANAVGDVVTVTSPVPSASAPTSAFYQPPYTPTAMYGVKREFGTSFVGTSRAFTTAYLTVPAAGQLSEFSVDGTWAVGDTWTVVLVLSDQSEITIGKGNISGIDFDFGFVHKQRGYIANGTQFNFSSINDVTLWEKQNLGAGFVVFQSQFGQEDKVQAFADYQGRLAVFGRRSVQIWQTDADPTQFALIQTLTNYGTVAPYSVHSLGELETFFLSDSGIRSLRARQTTLNAFVEDLGSPIDSIIQGVLNSLTDEEKAQAVGVIEPTRGSYWLYLDDTLYVLSYFPSAKIVAWSKYEMTYNNGTPCRIINNTGVARSYFVGIENDPSKALQTFSLANGAAQTIWFPAKYVWSAVGAADPVLATTLADGFVGEINHTAEAAVTTTSAHTSFVPKKFLIHRGQVFARDADAVYAYGGSDKVTFDTSIVTVELPWLDHDKPTTQKAFTEIDVGISGKWLVEAGVDPYSGGLEVTLVDGDATTSSSAKDSSFDKQTIPFNANGSHMKFKARSTSNNVGLAKLSTLVAKYM